MAGQVCLGLTFLAAGLYLALLLTAVLPETLAERQARLQIAAELSRRGLTAPGP